MALYEDGKIRFDDEFIKQFNSQHVQNFLKLIRFNLVDSKNSPYCTVEHLLYNKPVDKLMDELYWFILGQKNTDLKHVIEHSVDAILESGQLYEKLKEIRKMMEEENGW